MSNRPARKADRMAMRTVLEFIRRLAGWLRWGRSDEDLQEELRVHLALAAEDDAARGRTSLEAARLARVRAGGIAQAMDALRDQRTLPFLDTLRADVVFGWRQIARHRVASVCAVLSLGLAMGATLAAFRLVDAVLLRPLPVADPSRLFALTKTFFSNSDNRIDDRDDFDYQTYRRYVELAGAQADLMLVGMAAPTSIRIDSGERERVTQQFVSGNVFSTLGLQPAIGRLLDERDDAVPDGHPVAVIAHHYWQRRFGGDPAIVGRTFRMGNRLYEIVGVTREGFTGTHPGAITDLFVPSMMNPTALKNRGWTWFGIWLRPKPGIDPTRVQAVLQADFRAEHVERVKEFPPDAPQWRIDAFLDEQLLFRPAGSGISGVQKLFRRPLWILIALAALLLLIACANVANLLLARATTRKIEMALRLSIGAGRGRLIQLMLIESALLALLATAVAALFAWWVTPVVVSMLAPVERPIRLVLDPDWRLCFAGAALILAVTMIFGLVPALRASQTTPIDALKEIRSPRAHRHIADTLVALQTAFCVFLLFGASLFVGTFTRLKDRPLGFTSDRLLHLSVESRRTHPPEEWAHVAASLREIPRVESATVVSWAPLTGNRWRSAVTVAGRPRPEESPYWVSVSSQYFETMRIRMLDGRDFRGGDRGPGEDEGRPVAGVAIVNESFARVYFDGRNPVGQRVVAASSNALVDIVGLVTDTAYYSVREDNHPVVYIPLEQRYGATILVRTTENTADLPQVLRRELARIQPEIQVRDTAPFEAFVTQQLIRERLLAALSTFFAALALVLAIIGIYGVLNYAVTRERREIGLRMVLGARPAHVVMLVTTPLLLAVGCGAAIGSGAGVAFGRTMQALLFQTGPSDPVAFGTPLVALATAALFAVLPPAIRAARIDPAQTIRNDG